MNTDRRRKTKINADTQRALRNTQRGREEQRDRQRHSETEESWGMGDRGELFAAGIREDGARWTFAAMGRFTGAGAVGLGGARGGLADLLLGALVVAAEDHLPGSGLVHRGDDDVDRLVDHSARAIYDDHGAVVQIGDPLVVLLAFAQDEDAHCFAG